MAPEIMEVDTLLTLNKTTNMICTSPLECPLGYKQTETRFKSKFSVSPDYAQNFLAAEVKRMKGTDLILSSNVPARNDGMMFANAMSRSYANPGVSILFNYKGKHITMCCDQYLAVWENVYALAKGIEAMRAMERRGVSDFIERAMSGFTALPQKQEWWGVSKHANRDEVKAAYRALAKTTHPDAGGSHDAFQRINDAYSIALNFLHK